MPANEISDIKSLSQRLHHMLEKAHELGAENAKYQIKSAITHLLFLDVISQNDAQRKKTFLDIINSYLNLYEYAKRHNDEENFFRKGHSYKNQYSDTSFTCRYHDLQIWCLDNYFKQDSFPGEILNYDPKEDTLESVMGNSVAENRFIKLKLSSENFRAEKKVNHNYLLEYTRTTDNKELTTDVLKSILLGMKRQSCGKNKGNAPVPTIQDRVFTKEHPDGIPLLHYALIRNDENLIRTIFKHYGNKGDNYNFSDGKNKNNTTLHLLVENNYEINEIVFFYTLFDNPENILIQNDDGKTFLHLLIEKVSYFSSENVAQALKNIFWALLEKKPDIIKQWMLITANDGYNALSLAVRYCSESVTEYLLSILPKIISSTEDIEDVFITNKTQSVPETALSHVSSSVLMHLYNAGVMQKSLWANLASPLILNGDKQRYYSNTDIIKAISLTGYPMKYWFLIYSNWFKGIQVSDTKNGFFFGKKIEKLLKILSSPNESEILQKERNLGMYFIIENLGKWKAFLSNVSEPESVVKKPILTPDPLKMLVLATLGLFGLLGVLGYVYYIVYFTKKNPNQVAAVMGGMFLGVAALMTCAASLAAFSEACDFGLKICKEIQKTEMRKDPLPVEFDPIKKAILAFLEKFQEYGIPLSDTAKEKLANQDIAWMKKDYIVMLDEVIAGLNLYNLYQTDILETFNFAIAIPSLEDAKAPRAVVEEPPAVVCTLLQCFRRPANVNDNDLEAGNPERRPLLGRRG